MTGRRERGCKAQQRLIAALFARAADGAAVRDRDCRGRRWRPVDQRRLCASSLAAVSKRRRKRSFVAAGQADQSCREFFKIVERRCAFGLRGLAHLEARDELAEILIAGLRSAEQAARAVARRDIDAAAMPAA